MIDNKFWKEYFIFSTLNFLGLISLGFVFFQLNLVQNVYSTPERQLGISLILAIIKNNLINFCQYLCFPLSPIWILFDDIHLSFLVTTAIQTIGVKTTVIHLLPHGLIELPNLFLYQFLSIKLMRITITCFKNKQLSFLKEVKSLKGYYCFSLVLLIIAAMIEGGIG
ncbi:MAG: stage II sporulation protein M [Lactobacillales bacterium]|jgi:uncharacterized membrane protein SpoIIM required for sporulation|nr:stage II sporulation protein M [Lactobacillales bacterium]